MHVGAGKAFALLVCTYIYSSGWCLCVGVLVVSMRPQALRNGADAQAQVPVLGVTCHTYACVPLSGARSSSTVHGPRMHVLNQTRYT